MHSPNAFSMPARARRAWRVAVPVVVTGCLVAGAVVGLNAGAASAAGNGTYTVGADPVALYQATNPEMGTITPNADAADNGMFGSLLPFPVLPMHATVARNGHLVSFGTPVNEVNQAGIAFDDWNPTTDGHTDTAADHGYDSFCNAAVTLMDGRILMVSGQVSDGRDASMMSMLYDPNTRGQTMGANLAYKRWYVTALRLTDNRILLLGGADAGNTSAYLTPDDNAKVAYTPEIGTGTSDWTQLTGAASTGTFGAYDNRWWYPRAYNSPNGGVVGFSSNSIWTLDPNGAGTLREVGTLPYNPKVSGSQVMYAPGKILIAGGGQVNNTDEVAASAQAAILNVNADTPTAALTDPMHWGRNWLNLTVLPTGEVFANGGTLMGTDAGDANAVRTSEIWNPGTHSWRTAATNQVMRTYHSTSLVLPSGAVFTGGGGNPGPVDNFNAEMYYPSYLFTKDANGAVQWASRPAITAIAGSATYGGKVDLTIGDGRDIASASLITLPSVTHSQNTDQRRIPLTMGQDGNTVTATLPDSVNTMPPGDYELTVVDENGVPSAAQIITVRQGQPGLVTVGDESTNPTSAIAAPAKAAAPVADPAPGQAAPAPAPTTAPAPVKTTTPPKTGKTTVTLKKGSSISIESSTKAGYRLSHSGAKVTLKKVGSGSSKAAKKASSWIVRTGLGSSKGYSFESVDRPGYYLEAPADGSGALVLAKKSKSASFAKRVTFSSVKGVAGHDASFRLTSKASRYLRSSGLKLVVGTLGESSGEAKASTFDVEKGLAKR